MSSEERKEEKQGFTVQDRRRFSETGEVRPEYRDTSTDTAPPADQSAASPAQPAQAVRQERPPVELNFSMFVISLSTQAIAHLGEIPNPIDHQTVVDLAAAREVIDILGILKEKTKGNLDQSESGLLEGVLYDLRLKYVERVRSRS
jgi:hypothetical protein